MSKQRAFQSGTNCLQPRRVLSGMVTLLAATVLGAQQVTPSFGAVFDRYSTIKIAEGVYAFIAPDSRSAFVTGNSLLVIGTERALVVDAGHFPTLTRKMIAEVKRLTNKPVRYLVNTHWHEDHLAGNADYVKAFPGLDIVSTVATRDTIAHKVPAMLAREVRDYPGFLKDMRTGLASGVHPDGRPISPFSLEYGRNETNDLERAIPELAQIRVVVPNLAFDGELRIELGGREVHLLWLGLGNTPGDAVVWVPDAKVVATGDLVVAPTPYAFGSFIHDWPNTLRRVMALPATTVIPGHGPVMKDWSYVALVASMLDTLGAQMSRVAATTRSLDSARAQIDLGSFRNQIAGNDLFLQRAFDRFFLTDAVELAFNEAKRRAPKTGSRPPPGPGRRPRS